MCVCANVKQPKLNKLKPKIIIIIKKIVPLYEILYIFSQNVVLIKKEKLQQASGTVLVIDLFLF